MINRTYSQGLAWYALRIRSNQEKVVAAILENKGYEGFLPLYRSTRRWSDRVKQLDVPFVSAVSCVFRLGMGTRELMQKSESRSGTAPIPGPAPSEGNAISNNGTPETH